MKRYELIGNVSEQGARQRIHEWFPKQANIYAVLDFGVCFGIYDENRLLVGLEGHTTPTPLEWEYLQELRLFDKEKELLLVPSGHGWAGRIRRDVKECAGDNKVGEYVIDEYQKLWGRVEKDCKEGILGWSLLVSGRGTKIQIPVNIAGKEAAIHVRKYMRIPDVEKEEELVYQNDIRMVDFCSWEGGGEDGGNV